ncbi:MAG: GHMP family kinase ATP-binding protein [Promethearchaeota archaeon]|jgi:mevalonate kinase
MKPNITVKVPGRICLMGDKIDLLGKPVIGMAIDLMMTINYKERDNNEIEFYSHDTMERIKFRLGESPPRDIDLEYWSVLYDRLKGHIKTGFYIDVSSDIPIGAGLSTSAALSIGFIKALNQALDLRYSNKYIAELAYMGENHDLNIQCGRLDQYTETFGGIVFIQTNENPSVEYLDIEELPVVVGNSLEERKASLILNRVKKQLMERDPTTLKAFSIMENCVNEGREAILKKDFQKLGELMDIQQVQEGIIKTDTKKISNLCKAAKIAGALGAKQMGAGGGGCMVAIAPGRQKEVAQAINNAGGQAWIFDVFRY